MRTVTLPKLGLGAALARSLLHVWPEWPPFMGSRRWLYARGWKAVDALRFLEAAGKGERPTRYVYDQQNFTVRETFRGD